MSLATSDQLPDDPAALAALYDWPADAVTLRVNMVTSLDGRSTRDGSSGGLSSPADQHLMAVQRDSADVVIVGAGTIRVEGYGEFGRGSATPARLVVVSGTGLPQGLPALRSAARRPLVLTTTAGAALTPTDHADVLTAGATQVGATDLLAALSELGYRRLLCEGGPTLLTSLMTAGVVDELCLTHSPTIIGHGPGLLGDTTSQQWSLDLVHRSGNHLFTRHRRVR